MSTVGKNPVGRPRWWPGVVFPVGLTLLLGLACWQFTVGVRVERERIEAADLRLESYARLEAGELSSRARTLTQSLVDARLAGAREQEKNLRTEVRAVMEAVNRVLGASLERNRSRAAARRDVGQFPSGFEGVKNYLEIARPATDTDQAAAALRACAPELNALLPSGCSLAVIENNATELLSLGGGIQPEPAVSVAMSREFIWGEGRESRHWTLHLRLSAVDASPRPDAEELAEYLTREMGFVRLDNVNWRGWLLGPGGRTAAVFPIPSRIDGRDDDMPHFTNVPGEWVEIDGRQWVWLERPVAIEGQELTPTVAVSLVRTATPPELAAEFWTNRRWTFTLCSLAFLSLGMWVWFVRSLFVSRRVSAEPGSGRLRNKREEAAPRQRLVRSGPRAVPEVEGVIVADLDAEGGLRVAALAAAQAELAARHAAGGEEPVPVRVRPVALPSGSLFRLQSRHRGGKGRPSSRALDGATSPVLRELAARVRPVVAPGGGKKPHSPSGWDKVAE